MPENKAASRVTLARNTLFLYIRQAVVLLVSLYTVRVVIQELGLEDYGVFNLIAGISTSFMVLSGAMAASSQRYFAFDLGRGDENGLRRTFSVFFLIFIFIGLASVIVSELAFFFLISPKLQIPLARISAAQTVFHLSLCTFFVSLVSTPYIALVIARERMGVFAALSLLEALLRLAVSFLIGASPFDKLVSFGVLTTAVAILYSGAFVGYCLLRFPESRFKFVWDGRLFKDIAEYASWNLFGTSVGVAKNQLTTLIFGIFCGPTVIAARSIATQVNSAISNFIQNFITAARPQIVKSYSSGDTDGMLNLLYLSTKASICLIFIFIFPMILEMPFLLRFWLGDLPGNAVLFARLLLVDAFIEGVSQPLMVVVQATGKIRLYQAVVGGLLLLNLPASYVALSLGAPEYCAYVIGIALSLIAFVVRLMLVSRIVGFSIAKYLRDGFLTAAFACLIVSPIVIIVSLSTGGRLLGALGVFISCILGIGSATLLFVISSKDRKSLFHLINRDRN